MENAGIPAEDAAPERCPFLGQQVDTGTLICLSDVEPIAMSRRYADSYCLTAGHTACSLYIAAMAGERSMPPEVLAAAHATAGTTLLGTSAPAGTETAEPPRVDGEDEEIASDHEGMPAAEAAFLIADDERVPDEDVAAEFAPDTVIETRPLVTTPDGRARAVQMAEELGARVIDLREHVLANRARNEELSQRAAALEELSNNSAFLRRTLSTVPGNPLSAEEVHALQRVLQSLLRNPQDLASLVQLAQGGARLEYIVRAYGRVMEALKE